jgi:hypothetical protein
MTNEKGAANAAENKRTNNRPDPGAQQGPEVKSAVIDDAAIKSGRLRINRFSGHYRDAQFDDAGVSRGRVSAETAEALRRQFPNAEIEPVED